MFTHRTSISTACLLLPGLLAVLVYLNTLQADFVYDDHRAILKNGDLLPDAPLLSLFYNDFWGTPLTHSGSHRSYRPLCVLTFRLNYALGGYDPFGYHLGNIILHATVTITYVYTMYRATGDGFVATLAGFLFAAHPIHTEAVTGVVGRADLMSALFFLLSFLSYLQYYSPFRQSYKHDVPNYSAGSRTLTSCSNLNPSSVFYRCRWFIGTVVFALAAMLCKEHGITVICVCAVYDVFIGSKLHLNHLSTIFQAQHRRLLTGLSGLAIVGSLSILLRISLMGFKTPDFGSADNPASESTDLHTRILTFIYLPCFNFWLLLFPAELSFDWSMDSIPLINSCTDPRNAVIVIFYSVLGITLLRSFTKFSTFDYLKFVRRKQYNKKLANDVLCSEYLNTDEKRVFQETKINDQTNNMQLHETAESNLRAEGGLHYKENLQLNASLVENRTANVSVILPLALLVFPFIPATNLFFYVGFVVAERILYIPSMGFCLLIAEGVKKLRTRAGSGLGSVWCNRLLYMLVAGLVVSHSARTIIRNKDWFSEYTLYTSGISVNPAKALGNLANVLKAQGKLFEAEEAYKKALTHRSNMADVHYNLGILYQEDNRLQEAAVSYRTAIHCRPRLTPAYLNLGIVYSSLGLKTDARLIFLRCNATDTTGQKDPRLHEHTKVSALYHLGRLYFEEDKPQEAVEVYYEALARRPRDYSPHSLYNMLGEAYFKLGRLVEAERFYRQALDVKPDHIPAHLTLARLHQQNNQTDLAEQLLIIALSLGPHDANVLQLYGSFLNDVGRHSEAADHYLKSAELLPVNFETIFNAANSLRQAGRHEEAEVFYKKAVQLRPQELMAQMNLGAMLHYSGKLSEAELVYTDALKLNPDDAVLRSNYQKLRRLIAKDNNR